MSTEAKCNCQFCNGHIAFPAEMAGQVIACPHCEMETKLFVPNAPVVPPTVAPKPPMQTANGLAVNVDLVIKRGVSPLGIASLVLGIVACIFCWIPFLGIFILPIAFIGALLGIAGIALAVVNKKTGFSFPVSGIIACLLSVSISLLVTGGVSQAIVAATERARRTNQESVSQANGSPRIVEEWSKSATVKQGEVSVTMESKNSGLVQAQPASRTFYLVVSLTITNLSGTKKLDFESWAGKRFDFGSQPATLVDDNGNRYKIIVESGFDSGSSAASIYPKERQLDTITFEKPVQNYKWLHLELPASNFGGEGVIRFEIAKGSLLHEEFENLK